MLQLISQDTSPSTELYLMYDIACVLEKHLQVCHIQSLCWCYMNVVISMQRLEPDLLKNVHFVVPSFHSYGHKALYQVSIQLICSFMNPQINIIFIYRYSIVHCDVSGVGLTDGEGTERL